MAMQMPLRNIIQSRFDVNKVRYGNTLLTEVSRLNRPALVSLLLDNGANPNAICVDAETPIMNAAYFSKPEIVQLLIEHGANVKTRDERGANPVWYAVGGNPENIYLLVSQGSDINNVDKNGETPLLRAVDYYEKTGRGYVAIMTLLSLGASVNCTNIDGMTPLMLAAKQSDTNVIELLSLHQVKSDN